MTADRRGPDKRSAGWLLAAFEAVVSRSPDRVAVSTSAQRVTYAELSARSVRIARGLIASGVESGDRVVIALDRGVDQIAAMLGVARLGAAYVPIDPAWPVARRDAICALAKPKVILGPSVAAICELGDAHDADLGEVRADPESPLYVMFTSGTTGRPKGVVVPHRAVVRLVADPDYMACGPDRVWLHLAPTSFDAATLEIWTPLVRGGRVHVVTDQQPTLDGIASAIAEGGVTDAWITASLFNAMVDDRLDAFEGVRQILTGGERLSPLHVRRFLERWPSVRLINGYGPTENTTFTCCHTISVADADAAGGIPIGHPIGGTEVLIVDDDLNPVSQGETGELLAGGEGLALEYLGDAALTAERFVRIPSEGGAAGAMERWYRTGDLVRQTSPGGPIAFVGRRDRQVKIRGHRLELEEIESHLSAQPGVRAAFAFAIGSRADDRRLVAAIQTDHTEDVEQAEQADGARSGFDERALRRGLSERVPGYLIPDVIRVLSPVPVGANGKADLAAIRSVFDDLDAGDAIEEGARPVAPRVDPDASGDIESLGDGAAWSRFAALISAVLPGAVPTPDAGFLEIGGHSLAALRLSARMLAEEGVAVGIGEILRCQQLGDLAARLETIPGDRPEREEIAVGSARVTPAEESDFRASSIQRQFFFENAVDPTGIAYHEHAAFMVEGSGFEPFRLERAFRALVRRHEVLRTRLVLNGPELVQAIDPPEAAERASTRFHDGISWPGGEIPERVRRVVSVPFDLEADHPVRLDVFRCGPDRHAVIISFQHAAIDEWSLGVLSKELGLAYEDPSSVGRVAEPYRVYSAGEPHSADPAELDRILDRLASCGEPRTGLLRAPGEAEIVASEWFEDAEIPSLAARFGVTTTAFLAGVYSAALADVFDLDRVSLLTPVSHRTSLRAQSLVGCCNMMHPLVIDTSGAGTLAGLVSAVRNASDELIRVYEAPPVPYEQIARMMHQRASTRGGLSPFGFAVETGGAFSPELPGLSVRGIPFRGTIARFPMGFSVDRRAGSLVGSISSPRGPDARFLVDRVMDRIQANVLSLRQGAVSAASPARVAHTPALAEPVADSTADLSAQTRAIVSKAWEDLLGSAPADDHARFFDAGGHSLLLLRLAARLRTETGVEIPLGSFLDVPTFGRLLSIVSTRVDHDATPTASFQIEEFGTGSRVIVGIPGAFGRPLSFRRLADEFAARDADVRLRIYNLFDAMSERRVTGGFDLVLRELARDFESPATIGMLGFCAGGLYPMFLDSLPESQVKRVRLWLLNVFAPTQPSERVPLILQSVRDAAVDLPRLPLALLDSVSTLGRIAAVRVMGRDRGVSADQFSHAEFRQLLTRRELRPWRGQATAMIAGRKPIWRTYYRNTLINGLEPFLQGPTRMVVVPKPHHELLVSGAGLIADQILADIGSHRRKITE